MNDVLTDAIMSAGMQCLVEKLGVVEAEVFIWRKNNLWKDMTIDNIIDLAAEREKSR